MSGTHSNQFFKSWRETIKIFTFDSTVYGYICISHDHCCHVHVTHGHHTHSQNFFMVNKCPHCPNIHIVPLNVFAARQQNTILNDLLGGVGAPMMPTSVPRWCPHLCPDNSHITSWNPTNSLLSWFFVLNRKNIRISKSLKSSNLAGTWWWLPSLSLVRNIGGGASSSWWWWGIIWRWFSWSSAFVALMRPLRIACQRQKAFPWS